MHFPPKIIWSLWLQGWNEAPEIVRACTASWTRLNPGWVVRRLTRKHVNSLFPPTSLFAHLADDLPPEALSDIVRLELLTRFGGVWVDATTYCLVPLDGWLAPAMPQGFFAFDRPAQDRMLSSWFLAAQPASPVVVFWRALTERYWATRSERGAYFWLHYLFAHAYQLDPVVRRIWDETPKRSAASALILVPYLETLYAPPTEPARHIIETGSTPLLKLTHKLDSVENKRETLYRWLCDRELKFGPPDSAWEGAFE
jgi:hypothetical protein